MGCRQACRSKVKNQKSFFETNIRKNRQKLEENMPCEPDNLAQQDRPQVGSLYKETTFLVDPFGFSLIKTIRFSRRKNK